jgi:hypothetical protein
LAQTRAARRRLTANRAATSAIRWQSSQASPQPTSTVSALDSRSHHASAKEETTSSPSQASVAFSTDTEPEVGALTRRLESATEEALTSLSGRRALSEADFDDDLKARLLNKISAATFETTHAAALAEAGLTGKVNAAAGRGTRDIAAAQPWTGTESTEDAVLRMLTDAHKPLARELRGKPTLPNLRPVDMRITGQAKVSAGRKIAGAREKANQYTGLGLKDGDKGLSDAEKEAMRKEFRARFKPGAGVMPTSVTGLAELANKRIEDAISRGQFKNIPRGKDVARDKRADNPFIDTTEYIMNKMIKRQDIVPPWIDKQQELVKAANTFRSRLRNDWKRHAARTIASRGGSLESQMRRAEECAKAEEIHNPKKRNTDQIAVSSGATDDVIMQRLREVVVEEIVEPTVAAASDPAEAASAVADVLYSEASATPTPSAAPDPQITASAPFRDPAWEATERSYMTLAIQNLNTLTRSYNLIAPELAKKPYFSLERELNSAFADVAPQLANEIKVRASRPAKSLVPPDSGGLGGVLDRFGGADLMHTARVYESKAPKYGMKEFWRDLWSKDAKA